MSKTREKAYIPYVTAEPLYFSCSVVSLIVMMTIPRVVLEKYCQQEYNMTVCTDLNNKQWEMESQHIHHESSSSTMLIFGSVSFPSLFFVLLLGPLADKFGKRKVMFLPAICYFIQQSGYLFVAATDLHPNWFLAFSWLGSLFGSAAGLNLMMYSYMATSTRLKSRSFRFSILEGLYYMAAIPVGLISGTLTQAYGLYVAFLISTLLTFCNLLYTIFLLPPASHEFAEADDAVEESEDMKLKKALKLEHEGLDSVEKPGFNPLQSVKEVYRFIDDKNAIIPSILLSIVIFLLLFSSVGELIIGVLYFSLPPFELNSAQFGYYIAWGGLIRGLGVIVLTHVGIRVLKLSDIRLAMIAMTLQAVQFFLVTVVPNTTWLYVIMLTGIGMTMGPPLLRSFLTKLVDDNHHGTLLSIYTLLDLLGEVLTNIITNLIYQKAIKTKKEIVYYSLTGETIVALMIATFVSIKYKSLIKLVANPEDTNKEVSPLLEDESSGVEE